jgi:hypothetical protein
MQSDRFAREIVRILALSYAARLRRLMRNPFGRSYQRTLYLEHFRQELHRLYHLK